MYCYNCLKEIPDGDKTCLHCGYNFADYEVNNRALPPLTILAGKYMIGKVIGEGGFGITYVGIDLNLNLLVAIKEYFPLQLASRNTTQGGTNQISVIGGERSELFARGYSNYEKEARRLASIENLPGIVHVLNFFYENNTAYMVMDYIHGRTLKDLLKEKKGGLGWKRTLEYMEPVIKSLAIVHKNGIIHRDISPDNIMQRDDGAMILIDFGAAREMDNDGKSKTIELKHGYAPPEQYQTHGNQGTWTDVYAMCATIYRLICGEQLPDAMSLYTGSSKIKPIRTHEKTFPKALEAALMKGLNPRIDDRIRDMDELYVYLYGGRRLIPWKKISKYSIMACSSLAVIVIAIILVRQITRDDQRDAGSEDLYENTDSFEDDGKQSSDDRIENDEPETQSAEETDTKVDENEKEIITDDTAIKYINDNGLAYTDNNLIKTEENGDGLSVTSTDYTVVDVVIPENINGKQITSIKGVGSNVTTLVLPDTIKSIEANAFKNCVYMETIYIPASVESIGTNAFENCASLKNIFISSQNSTFYVEDGKILDKDGKVYN